MSEWISLNPKVYSFNIYKSKEIDELENYRKQMKQIAEKLGNKKVCKGISKVVVKNQITHNDYVNTLQTNKPLKREVISIKSLKHQLYTYKMNKIALTSYYDKMKMINEIDCIPYGYKG